MGEEIAAIPGGVEVGGGGFEKLFVPGLTDGGDFFQNMTHNLVGDFWGGCELAWICLL